MGRGIPPTLTMLRTWHREVWTIFNVFSYDGPRFKPITSLTTSRCAICWATVAQTIYLSIEQKKWCAVLFEWKKYLNSITWLNGRIYVPLTNICEYILLFLKFSYYFLTLTVILMYLTSKIFRKQGWHHLGSEAQKLEQFFCNHNAVRIYGRTI